jgi:hypothetical protein
MQARQPCSLFVWLVADGWYWFVLREKYCWLVADKPKEQCALPSRLSALSLVRTRMGKRGHTNGATALDCKFTVSFFFCLSNDLQCAFVMNLQRVCLHFRGEKLAK